MRLPEDFIQELKSRNDIEEVIGRYCEIQNRGSRQPKCLCPFHSEKTASFTIYTNTQSYYCFGCQSGGDVIRFLMNIERLDYMEAVKSLAERSGLAMPQETGDDRALKIKRRCYSANREAAKYFHHILSTDAGKAGREYLAGRKLTDETIKHFGLGFAPDSWDSLVKYMKHLGYTEQELIAFDLAQQTKNGGCIDRFRNRVMFPIIDLRGNVIAFTGRILDASGATKYMNTRDTVVYKKSHDIFALNFAKNNSGRKLILCEGNMDAITMHQYGFTNAVAAMGTAFTKEQISLLSRYCDELYLCFDNDAAGLEATHRAINRLSGSSMKLRVVRLKGGKDADEILNKYGADYVRRQIENDSTNDTEFALSSARAKYDMNTEDGKLNYSKEAVQILAALSDSVEEDLYASRLSSEIGVTKEAVLQQIKKQKNYRKKAEANRQFEDAAGMLGSSGWAQNPQTKEYSHAVRAEEILLATLIRSPDFFRKLGTRLSADTFITDLNRRFFTELKTAADAQRTIDFSLFSDEEDGSADASYLSYLLAKGSTVQCSISECDECIQKLLAEKMKRTDTDVSHMSDEDFLKAFRARADRKNNGGQ